MMARPPHLVAAILLLLAPAILSAQDRPDPLHGVVPFGSDQPWPIEPPPHVASPTNPVIRPRVLVLNFEPRVPSAGNRRLWEVFNWHDPRALAAGFIRDLSHISGGAVVPEIVEWRDLEEFPVFTDGFRYSPDEYVANRRIGASAPWHPGQADFRAIARQHDFARLINDGKIDEVWLFGDHYFYLLGEDWMAGPGAFFINGSVFPDFPVDRAFAGFGFSYERHTAEMIHNLAHRTENHLKRAYGGWNRKQPATPWDRFTINVGETGGDGPFGVGTCHYPANGRKDYDYTDSTAVPSTAVDWLNYPNLTGKTSSVSVETWTVPGTKRGPVDSGVGKGFEHLQYQRWFFSHLPRAEGTTADGRQNNWFKYIFDFNAYAPDTGLPRDDEAFISAGDAAGAGVNPREVRVRFYSARGIDPATLGNDDVEIVTAGGKHLVTTLKSTGPEAPTTAGVAQTARYTWSDDLPPGTYTARLIADTVRDRAGRPVREATTSFTVKPQSSRSIPVNALVAAGLAEITGSPSELGGLPALFDGDPNTTMRSKSVNPATVQVVFKEPVTVGGLTLFPSAAQPAAHAYRWTVEAADTPADCEAKNGSYRVLVSPAEVPSDAETNVALPQPVTARVFKLTAQRLVGDDFVHLDAWELLTPVTDATSRPAVRPTARRVGEVKAVGASRSAVEVEYSGTILDRRSLGNDLHIVGPNGESMPTWVGQVETGDRPTSVRVTYTFATLADHAAMYHLVLTAGQVYDVDGNANEAADLGELSAAH